MNCPHNIPIEARCHSCVHEAMRLVERTALMSELRQHMDKLGGRGRMIDMDLLARLYEYVRGSQ